MRDARIVILLLMPPRAHEKEVRILADVARTLLDPTARERLLEAQSESEALAFLEAKPSPEDPLRRSRTSLADI